MVHVPVWGRACAHTRGGRPCSTGSGAAPRTAMLRNICPGSGGMGGPASVLGLPSPSPLPSSASNSSAGGYPKQTNISSAENRSITPPYREMTSLQLRWCWPISVLASSGSSAAERRRMPARLQTRTVSCRRSNDCDPWHDQTSANDTAYSGSGATVHRKNSVTAGGGHRLHYKKRGRRTITGGESLALKTSWKWRGPVFAGVVRPRPGSCTVVSLSISRKLPLLMVKVAVGGRDTLDPCGNAHCNSVGWNVL